jgi:hypothetical protein
MERHDHLTPGRVERRAPETCPPDDCELPPPDLFDPVIEAYKKDIDRTLLIDNLRRPVAERLARFQSFMNAVGELRGAGLPPDMREKLFGKDD